MKLLNCLQCHSLSTFKREWHSCECGQSSARYLGDDSAEYVGPARILGIRNDQYEKSLRDRNPQLDYVWFEIENKPGFVRKILK